MSLRVCQYCPLLYLLGCLPSLPGRDTQDSAAPVSCHALEFDGIDHFVRVEHSDSLSLSTSDFTIEMWVRMLETDLEVINMGHILTKQSGTNYLWLGYTPASSGWKPRTTWSNSESEKVQWTGDIVIEYNTWAHLVLEREGNVMRFRVNGENPTIQTNDGSGDTRVADFNFNNTGPVVLSRDPNTSTDNGLNGWPGQVAAVQILPRSVYGGDDFEPLFPLSLQVDALLSFDMGSGDGAELWDSSGNHNHGEITGARWVGLGDLDCGAESR